MKPVRYLNPWDQWPSSPRLEEGEGDEVVFSKSVFGRRYEFEKLAGLSRMTFVSVHDPVRAAQVIEEQLRAAFGHSQRFTELCQRVENIERLLQTVGAKIDRLIALRRTLSVPIESFAPEPYEVVRPLVAIVAEVEDGFESSFFDANIHAYGDTETEAVTNLKGAVLDAYDQLSRLQDRQLGPDMAKQKRILSLHIRKTEER